MTENLRMTEEPEYKPIALGAAEALLEDEATDIAVYLSTSSDNGPTLYRESGVDGRSPDFSRLRRNGVSFLYVKSGDFGACATVLESKLAALLKKPDLEPPEKAIIVQHVGTAVARDLTEKLVSPEGGQADGATLNRAADVVDNVIGSILREPAVAAHILHMAEHERTTASHMFVVAALAVTLGREVFGSDREMLTGLGLAGMTHDIGKLAISPALLSKTEPLTTEEFRLIQQHPVESVRLLGSDPRVTPAVRQMILQHHERIDGRGYPLGLSGEELFPGSCIVSIVDSFHAMIGQRSYRSALTPDEANRRLAAHAGRQFHADFVARWLALFERCHREGQATAALGEDTPESVPSTRQEHRPAPKRDVFGPRARRFPCNPNVKVRCLYSGRLKDATCAPDEFVVTLKDVSRGGLCFYSDFPMYRGEAVHVQLQQDEPSEWVRGTVAWCRQKKNAGYTTGIRFVERVREAEANDPVAIEGIAPPPEARPGDDTAEEAAERSDAPVPAGQAKTTTQELKLLDRIAATYPIGPKGEADVLSLAASSHPQVRRKTAEVLAKIGTRPARQALIALLSDEDTEVREHTVTIAGVFRMHETSYALRQLLSDPVKTVALRAAGALGRLEDKSGLPLVTATLQSDSPLSRLAAYVFGEIVGHRFTANADGVTAARRYLTAKRPAAKAS